MPRLPILSLIVVALLAGRFSMILRGSDRWRLIGRSRDSIPPFPDCAATHSGNLRALTQTSGQGRGSSNDSRVNARRSLTNSCKYSAPVIRSTSLSDCLPGKSIPKIDRAIRSPALNRFYSSIQTPSAQSLLPCFWLWNLSATPSSAFRFRMVLSVDLNISRSSSIPAARCISSRSSSSGPRFVAPSRCKNLGRNAYAWQMTGAAI